MLDILLYAMILAGFQAMLPNTIGLITKNYSTSFLLSARDNPPEATLISQRARRAWLNLMESMPFFLALGIIGLFQGIDLAPVMLIWLIARLIYLPAYLFAIPLLRTVIWIISIGALIQMGLPISAVNLA